MTPTRFAQATGTLLTLVAAVSNSGSAADVIPQFVARDGAFHMVRDGQDTQLFVHAVNLGVGVPGTQPGALAAAEAQYTNWLRQIGGMGFRAVRIYTLHYPRFYKALRDYNLNNPEAPLYLFHGVWLDEENPSGTYDLHAFTPIFTEGITQAVRAVHGDITIPDRWGRAYGAYTNDVSPWVLGWIIGREIYAYEVYETKQAHTNDTSFVGTCLSLPVGSPAECWVTARLDDLARYEQEEFGTSRPVSFSSWPTLDPLYHVSENSYTGEDSEAVDLANLDTSRFAPGYFASYHVYPFYPDFIDGDPAYRMVRDLEGPNSYLGYLRALHGHYYPKPLFVAEFGVPTSWGDAHIAFFSGMDHGGHDEKAQGHYAARMFHNIAQAGCAGGALFGWIDEWWKTCWITTELDFPTDRRYRWHNVTSPEQNFGLIAFDEDPRPFAPVPLTGSPGPVQAVSWAATHRFFELQIATDPAQRPLVIGFDTHRTNWAGVECGETVLPNGTATPVRTELALVLDGQDQAQLYVTRAYDLFGIWHDRWGYANDPNQLYYSTPTDGAPWHPVRWLSNLERVSDRGPYIFPETVDPIGQLRVSKTGTFVTSLDAVALGEGIVRLRLPWTLLQFSDPSRAFVIQDLRRASPPHPELRDAPSEGIRLVIAQGTGLLVSDRLLWNGWEDVTGMGLQEREKASVPILEQYLLAFDHRLELRLRIVARTADRLTLDWLGGGILQSAPTVAGPWSSVGQGAPTFVALPPSGNRFFRVER